MHNYFGQQLFAGILLFAAALTIFLIDVILPVNLPAMYGTIYTYSTALGIGVGLLGITYGIGAFWDDVETQIDSHYRPLRWVGHALAFWFIFQVYFHVLGQTDVFSLWLLPIALSFGLAYIQSSHESMNAKTTSKATVTGASVISTWPKGEGWITGLLIVAALGFTTLAYGLNNVLVASQVAVAVTALVGYTVLHAITLLATLSWDDNTKKTIGNSLFREWLFIVGEILIIGVFYTVVIVYFWA